MIQLFKPHISEEAISAVVEVLKSGWIGLGPKTAEFESRFAEYVGSKYAVFVNSATSALHLALIVSGISAGDEVLTTPLTFVSTNHAILYLGAAPVFVDVDNTLNIDINKAEKLITPKVKAIMVVHYGGNPVDIEQLYAFAARYNLAVIEDAAHACGAVFKNKRVGSFGLTCFSFHAVKNLPIGDGGMITTSDDKIYESLIKLRWMGIDRSTFSRNQAGYQWEYNVCDVGYKYHGNDIMAAIGIEHLKRLDEWNARRAEIVSKYRLLLSDIPDNKLTFIETTNGAISANHLCVICVKQRDMVVDRLKLKGIGVGVHYKPNHEYQMYHNARRGDLSVVENKYPQLISLPLHLYLSDSDIALICQSLREAIA